MLKTTARTQYNSFLTKVMEPLTESELVDTHYNNLVRRARREPWMQAKIKTQYYDSLRQMAAAAESEIRPKLSLTVRIPSYDTCLGLYRSALAEQMLTPAETKVDIDWKKSMAKSSRSRHLPITQDQMAEAIEADELFLANHPIARNRGTSSSSDPVDIGEN